MAIRAFGRQGLLVVIFVASQAFLFEAQKGELLFLYIGFFDKCWFMAVFAALFGMFSCQLKTCYIVVKLSLIEPDDLEFPAMMIVMAMAAVLAFYLGRNMIAFIGIDLTFNFEVTGKAFGIGYLIAKVMAFGAV